MSNSYYVIIYDVTKSIISNSVVYIENNNLLTLEIRSLSLIKKYLVPINSFCTITQIKESKLSYIFQFVKYEIYLNNK